MPCRLLIYFIRINLDYELITCEEMSIKYCIINYRDISNNKYFSTTTYYIEHVLQYFTIQLKSHTNFNTTSKTKRHDISQDKYPFST